MAIERTSNVAMFRIAMGSYADDELRVLRFRAVEGISQLWSVDLELVSEDSSVDFESVVGQNATLTIDSGDENRYFDGVVARFEQGALGRRFSRYYARIVPQVWLLNHRIDSRIFQEMSVPDIVTSVLKTAGIPSDRFEFRTQADYKQREYCVQYRESDWNFVARLLEDEGIFFFFEHEAGAHKLVMGDSTAVYQPIAGESPAVPLREPTGLVTVAEYVSKMRIAESVRTGSVEVKDFSFKTPKVTLESTNKAKAFADLQLYDHPAEIHDSSVATHVAGVRLEELQALRVVGTGESVCHRFTPGYRFELEDHPRSEFNTGYVVTDLVHEGYEPQTLREERPDISEETSYANDFRVLPVDVVYRPPRTTPRPYIRGTQSATTVGPSGEEIYCDEFGRVKVQFHWDREGANDEHSSCWVRVSQQWAGPGYGFQTIPRIGNEVIVGFHEGNPDQPHVIGRVYNADNMPPFSLPDSKNQTGIKSESTKGGGGSNEIRMDDTKGSEEVYIHAEKDENIAVGNNKSESVGNDETVSIGNDRKETVGNNETTEIGTDRTETVGSNETITIGADRTENVGKNETVTIALMRTHTVGVNDMLNVGAAQEVTVGAAQAITVGAAQNTAVGAAQGIEVGATRSVTAGKDISEDAGKNYSINVGDDYSLKAGKKILIDAGDEITIKTGKAKIQMKKNGDITIEGKKISVKASGDIVMKGKKILGN